MGYTEESTKMQVRVSEIMQNGLELVDLFINKNCNYSAYKTPSIATKLYFFDILGISKSISEDISYKFFT